MPDILGFVVVAVIFDILGLTPSTTINQSKFSVGLAVSLDSGVLAYHAQSPRVNPQHDK